MLFVDLPVAIDAGWVRMYYLERDWWRRYSWRRIRVIEADLFASVLSRWQVMLTTDQHYTLSTVRPEVKWVRQVHPDTMEESMRSDGR